jgi:type I site-specific restriction endonuclease
VVALRARMEAIARHLTDFLKKTDRFAKTIVFCVDQEHASDMRQALSNLNRDLVVQHPDYVCRVTADEGDIGRGHLGRFQDVDTKSPVILTTSQLLTTGVDAPTCKNVMLARVAGSMTEFKQIIGRGTRVRYDYGKLWFNIIDYTGSATRLFADPAFDGDPVRETEEALTPAGETQVIRETEPAYLAADEAAATIIELPSDERRKYYFDGGQVEIAAHLVYELDPDGGVDIIAHKDELGFEPPIVKVQVKSAEGSIGDPIVSALYGKVASGEFGLLVTLGTFTNQARHFAWSKSNLRPVDGHELVDLMLQHYEPFDSRYKGLLPLKRVYVPEALAETEA